MWKASTANRAALPDNLVETPKEDGDGRLVLDENRMYRWNEATYDWLAVSRAFLTGPINTITELLALDVYTLQI